MGLKVVSFERSLLKGEARRISKNFASKRFLVGRAEFSKNIRASPLNTG
jgi:hypothetical protein